LYTFAGSDRIKILEAAASAAAASGEPGTARLDSSGRLVVTAGEGSVLELARVQRAGKGPVTGAELARSLGPIRFGKPLA
jgi:methionyl-tRNA formyltransferase